MGERLLVALLTMGGLGLFFSLALVLANRKLKIEEDPRIAEIAAVLPELNCAACGFASCGVYAEMVAQGKAPVGSCLVGGKDVQAKIAEIMQAQIVEREGKVACVRCQGGNRECKKRFRYLGVISCAASNLLNGGDKACVYGCLGYADCVRACPCDAIAMNDNALPVVDEQRCMGCGLCVRACPREIICLITQTQKIYLGCISQDKGKAVKEICAVGCFACTLCANPKVTPDGLIVMQGNLPAIKTEMVEDWSDLDRAVRRCPAKCYVVKGAPRQS